MARVLSIAPYRFLPNSNGGHWAVFIAEKILSVFNDVHVISTKSNDTGGKQLPFKMHLLLSDKKSRYIPLNYYKKILRLAKELQPDYIFCHHHYMFPTIHKVAKLLKIPVYVRSHDIESLRSKGMNKWWWRQMRWFEKSSYSKADAVFFITNGDREWAIKHYGLSPQQAVVMPFGIDIERRPLVKGNEKDILSKQFSLSADARWLFFMGQLDYLPNAQCVEIILREIYPRLKNQHEDFQILICGNKLSELLQQEINEKGEGNIRYLGFVPDIVQLMNACEAMINPVIFGGGVKTKAVESLANNKTVVSTTTGAEGIEMSACGDKLLVAKDNDWDAFTNLILGAVHSKADIPDAFYDYYYINHVAERMQRYFDPAISKSTYPV